MATIRPSFFSSALAATIASSSVPAFAQCPFDPTVTPPDLILCPNEQGLLSTQVYDSYQWYKAGAPINGETGPTLSVDQFNDAGYSFSVEATLDGCTEMSPEVLVDGWVFLLPFVMTVPGEPLYYTQNGPVYCGLDTVLLVMMPPYDTNIQWTNFGTPIPGATDDTLVVTTAGSFSASGSPSLCPGFVQQLGVTIDILFQEPAQPVIVPVGDQLCASPAGLAYQWYLNDVPLDGVDTECIDPFQPGAYSVDVIYEIDCSIPSEPFIITSVDDLVVVPHVRIGPVPANDRLTITSPNGTGIGPWLLFDATGRIVLRGDGLKHTSTMIDVSALEIGTYRLRTSSGPAQPVVIMR